MHFVKMHGIGNDYVFVDCMNCPVPENLNDLAIKVSKYHFGIGSDGLVIISQSSKADCRMRIFNADGSEAMMCGNATSCIGRYMFERGYVKGNTVTMESNSGVRTIVVVTENSKFVCSNIDIGTPILDPALIPAFAQGNPPKINLFGHEFTCVSMGTPHAVAFVDDVASFDVPTIGKAVEFDSHFPERVNVEFVEIVSRKKVIMRVWERGSGITLACGTGACAVLVACVLNGHTDRDAIIELPGGSLRIAWDEIDNHVHMYGKASIVFEGEFIDD